MLQVSYKIHIMENDKKYLYFHSGFYIRIGFVIFLFYYLCIIVLEGNSLRKREVGSMVKTKSRFNLLL